MSSSVDRREFLRRSSLASVGAAAATTVGPATFTACQGGSSSPAEPPNIVVILADDMGFSDIGCYGSEIETPNVDQLADDGMRFTQFYNAARCCPSRASLLTGLYPHKAGIGHLSRDYGKPGYQGHLTSESVTLGEALGEAGYFTGMVGKWHVGHQDEAYWPSNRGFDRFYGEHNYVDDYFKPTHQLYLNGTEVEPEGEDWYSTDAYTDYALQFMDEAHQAGQPFCMYVAYNAPHFPLQAFQEDIAKYEGEYGKRWSEVRQKRYDRLREMGLIDDSWTLSEPSLLDPESEEVREWLEVEDDSREQWDLKMAAYAAQVDRMDQNIGRLLRRLEQLGVADNTMVMFLSDNGGCAEDWINSRNPEGVAPGARNCKLAYGPPWANVSDTPFRRYKRWVHEGGIATPLVVRWPDVVEPGSVSRQMGHVVDLLPTFLEAAGASYPSTYDGEEVPPMQGESLLPVLRGREEPIHDTLFWEHEGNRAVRKGDWKLVESSRFSEEEWELYNMADDRTETNDLADERPERVAELEEAYQNWADRSNVIPWEKVEEIRSS